MRGGRGHCDGGRVQVNYRAISAAFNFTHKSEKKKKKNSVCVPALYRTVYVRSVCAHTWAVSHLLAWQWVAPGLGLGSTL